MTTLRGGTVVFITIAGTLMIYPTVSRATSASSRTISGFTTCEPLNRQPVRGFYPEARFHLAYVPLCLLTAEVISLLALSMTVDISLLDNMARVSAIVFVWKGCSAQYDVLVSRSWQKYDRLVLGLLVISTLPGASTCLIPMVWACGRMGQWTHHVHICGRLIKAGVAFELMTTLLKFQGIHDDTVDSTALAVVLFVITSHYMVAGLAKMILTRPYGAWIGYNRIWYLIIAARDWGCLSARHVLVRFPALPWDLMGRWICGVTMLIEIGAPLCSISRKICFLYCIVMILFHAAVFVLSGILFWENSLILAILMVSLPDKWFGYDFPAWLICLAGALVGVACFRGFPWAPSRLGWWDSPLTEKLELTAITEDGREYALGNRVLAPFDRVYARTIAEKLSSDPIITCPLGGVEDYNLIRQLYRISDTSTSSDLPFEKEKLIKLYGVEESGPSEIDTEILRLKKLAQDFNDEEVLTGKVRRAFRWLKAPLGHFYDSDSQGRVPYSRRYGRIRRVMVRRVDHMYLRATENSVLISSRDLFCIEIPARKGQ
jgi:hypothetical protein